MLPCFDCSWQILLVILADAKIEPRCRVFLDLYRPLVRGSCRFDVGILKVRGSLSDVLLSFFLRRIVYQRGRSGRCGVPPAC